MAGTASSLVAGVVFGLALAAPPGPMNAIIAEESVLRGWLAGVTAGLGAMSADACFFVLALVGVVTVVREAPLVRGLMIAAGGLLMLYFAYGAARDASTSFGAGADGGPPGGTTAIPGGDEAGTGGSDPGGFRAVFRARGRDRGRGFRKAFVLALTNPYQIAFWLTVGVGLLRPGTLDVLGQTPYVGGELAGMLVVETGSPALVAGLFGGIVVWVVGFPATLVALGRRVDRLAPVVAYGSAVVLSGFGLLFLSDAAALLA